MNQSRKYCVILILLSLLAACTTAQMYDGPVAGSQDVAIIKGIAKWFALSPIAIDIKKVDGKAVSPWASSVSVRPGEHIIEANCYVDVDGQRYFYRNQLSVVTKPGKIYYLESKLVGNHCEISYVEGAS